MTKPPEPEYFEEIEERECECECECGLPHADVPLEQMIRIAPVPEGVPVTLQHRGAPEAEPVRPVLGDGDAYGGVIARSVL